MRQRGMVRGATVVMAVAGLSAPALAQAQVIVDRGLTDDLPYTAIYPNVLNAVDDGNPETILTLQHPGAALQCDFFAVPGAREDWTAEDALTSLDVAGVEATWAPQFPGFEVTGQSITRFASGPALLYEGASENSPLDIAAAVVHAEAVDNGRTYVVECLLDQAIAADARPMIDFIIANFSTRSDAQCCIDPADDRG